MPRPFYTAPVRLHLAIAQPLYWPLSACQNGPFSNCHRQVACFDALSCPFLLCPHLGRCNCSFLGARVHQKAKTGRCEGRKPYGFFEGKGDVLSGIKALRAQGLGFDRLAARLNESGRPSDSHQEAVAWVCGQSDLDGEERMRE
jgi:hypothetical protein